MGPRPCTNNAITPTRHENTIPSSSVMPQHIIECEKQERKNKSISNQNPISNTHCDACVYCYDVCLDPTCSSCHQKIKSITCLVSPSDEVDIRSCLHSPFSSPRNKTLSEVTSNTRHEVIITPCHLRRHNTKNSAWLLCGDVIYDATDFIAVHPGGERCILKKSGGAVDCSRDMTFHSSRAIKLWKDRRIGRLKPCRCDPAFNEIQNEPHVQSEQCVIS
eukprot:CAMPEP_0204638304 /NCGR_PEP_ID=MMETSP0717-20131115/39194_1 /ASSEMBLY_ACC=CAM_ASM_000666 /TAXON_ID=230516 /ORGANISM="Chaetoceros curvisetus" /LENGTH=218 /DNA_ID=CAMNT_0051658043 /DNA_START=29 /DNA_END=685 /DNA_ORIENTATION=-